MKLMVDLQPPQWTVGQTQNPMRIMPTNKDPSRYLNILKYIGPIDK